MARTTLDTSMGPPMAEVAGQVGYQGFINIVCDELLSLHFGGFNLLFVALRQEVNLSSWFISITYLLSGSVDTLSYIGVVVNVSVLE